jgi:hypothetical protein
MTSQGNKHAVYVGDFWGQEEMNNKCRKTMHMGFNVHAKKHVRHSIHYNSLIVMKIGIRLWC